MRKMKLGKLFISALFVICVVIMVCFLTNPERAYQIKITVPAGSTAGVVYSEEEISPKRGSIRVSAGEGLGDTEVVLLPVEIKEENAHDEPAYLTPGMPVKLQAEKGGWYKIGVSVQNPTDQDLDVYVSVKGVTVRIADEDDIHAEITYEIPAGLTESSYSDNIGFAGGCLLGPDAYQVYGESDVLPAQWKAAGMICRFYTENQIQLVQEDNQISEVYTFYIHTTQESLGKVDGLCAPAYLLKMNHDLYTAVTWMELEEAADESGQITLESGEKISLDAVESTSDYWYIVLARPGDEIGYIISLNAKNFSEEDIIAFAKTVKYLK